MRRMTRTAVIRRLAENGIVGLAAFVLVVVLLGGYIAATAALGGWLLMLLLGVVHSYAASVPAISFLSSWGTYFLARAVIGGMLYTLRSSAKR